MEKELTTISTLLLERYLCNEVTAREKERIEHALTNDKELQQRLSVLRISTNSILSTYPADAMAREIELRSHTQAVAQQLQQTVKKHAPGFTPSLRAIGLTCMLLLVVPGVLLFINNHTTLNDTTRIKGQRPFLTIYRNTGSGYEKLPDGAAASARDQIQIGYVAAGKKYGCIFSVDGRGSITCHFPEQATAKPHETLLLQNGEHLLTQAFELDEAPRFERFFFVTSDDSIDMQSIISQNTRQFTDSSGVTKLLLPERCQQISFTLYKEVSP